ncbi:MAG TPA: hypothetical protein VLA14_15245 [Polyangia bacterium]|jgi:hypothetical protein|nr:hypothetical protein [Polyangia bacterium]
MRPEENAIKVLAQIWRMGRAVLTREREVTARLRADVEAVIYDRPGLWMDDARLARLQAELQTVARAAVPGSLAYGVLKGERAPFENRLVVVARNTTSGEVAGFNALPWLTVELGGRTVTVMHFGLLIIHPRHQRQGLQGLLYGLGAFSAFHRSTDRPLWISNVTEVPAVFGAVCDQVQAPYPSFRGDAPPTPTQRALATAIMDRHRHEFGVGPEAGFDADRFVITGSYTGGSDALKKTFESAPPYRDPACNDFCRAQLDYGRGDDFLQIGQLDATVVTNWLTRRIPAELRPALARQMKVWNYP